MQIRYATYLVVNWHIAGISLTWTDHYALLSELFCVILMSTLPSIIQGTGTLFRLEKCCLAAKFLRYAWHLPDFLLGRLYPDKRLKSYIHINYRLEYLNIQVLTCDKGRHFLRIASLRNFLPLHSCTSHRPFSMVAILHKWAKTRSSWGVFGGVQKKMLPLSPDVVSSAELFQVRREGLLHLVDLCDVSRTLAIVVPKRMILVFFSHFQVEWLSTDVNKMDPNTLFLYSTVLRRSPTGNSTSRNHGHWVCPTGQFHQKVDIFEWSFLHVGSAKVYRTRIGIELLPIRRYGSIKTLDVSYHRCGHRVVDKTVEGGPSNSIRFWRCGLFPCALMVPRLSAWNFNSTLTGKKGLSDASLSFYRARENTKKTNSALWVTYMTCLSQIMTSEDASWLLMT